MFKLIFKAVDRYSSQVRGLRGRVMQSGSVANLALLCILTSHPSLAETVSVCDDPMVGVVARDESLARRICDVVDRAKPQLARCQLFQVHPLEIQVRDGGTELGLLGYYSKKNNLIVLQSPANLEDMLDAESAYHEIPAADFFESVVVHELAHAFFLETRCGYETCLAGHEYIASAMQFQSLPAQSRDRLLKAMPNTEVKDIAWFTEDRLRKSPEVFAANAWRHFSQKGNGCGFIANVLSGEIVFPSEFE